MLFCVRVEIYLSLKEKHEMRESENDVLTTFRGPKKYGEIIDRSKIHKEDI
jgi:hypothetical protein